LENGIERSKVESGWVAQQGDLRFHEDTGRVYDVQWTIELRSLRRIGMEQVSSETEQAPRRIGAERWSARGCPVDRFKARKRESRRATLGGAVVGRT
jgi:hypothetical protein